MPFYRVLLNEIWVREFEVEARTPAEAYDAVCNEDDSAEEVEFSYSYCLEQMPEDVEDITAPEVDPVYPETLRDCDD